MICRKTLNLRESYIYQSVKMMLIDNMDPSDVRAELQLTEKTYVKKTFHVCSYLLITIVFAACASMQSSWQNAASQDTIAGYQDFLRRYPDGDLADQAQAKIDELTSEANKRREEALYIEAKTTDTVQSYTRYLNHYPHGQYTQQIQKLMEPALYREARTRDAVDMYDQYLTQYPTGPNTEEIHKLRESALYRDARTRDSAQMYMQYLEEYPEGSFAPDAKEKIQEAINEQLLTAVLNANETEVRRLLRLGADANTTNNRGQSGLHIAAKQSEMLSHLGFADFYDGGEEKIQKINALNSIIRELLQSGALVDATDSMQRTPLSYALASPTITVSVSGDGSNSGLSSRRNYSVIKTLQDAAAVDR